MTAASQLDVRECLAKGPRKFREWFSRKCCRTLCTTFGTEKLRLSSWGCGSLVQARLRNCTLCATCDESCEHSPAKHPRWRPRKCFVFSAKMACPGGPTERPLSSGTTFPTMSTPAKACLSTKHPALTEPITNDIQLPTEQQHMMHIRKLNTSCVDDARRARQRSTGHSHTAWSANYGLWVAWIAHAPAYSQLAARLTDVEDI